LLKDKKRESNDIYLVLLNEIGKAVIRKTPVEELKN